MTQILTYWILIMVKQVSGSWVFDARMNDLAPFSHTLVNENWSHVLTTRHLLCGLKPTSRFNPNFDEYYNPQCIACQFGLYQHIPLSCPSCVPRSHRGFLASTEIS
jgi:hypothetical protein